MDIIVVSHKRGRTWRLSLHPRDVLGWLPIAIVSSLICGLAFAAGYMSHGEGSVLPTQLVSNWAREVDQQRTQLVDARQHAEEDAQALSRRIAQLHAHVIRLDAVGERLTQVAGLESGEFDFSTPPPVGGPEIDAASDVQSLAGVLNSLNDFETKLSDRERQLRVLEDLLLASRLQKEIKPSGWPSENSYISSTYGWRTDPFTGRIALHTGIDFAGRSGSDVVSVASGVVITVETHPEYGRMVEVNHGNGYVTRYGHNQKVVVKVGDRVHKGERIALMGSTGRSSGTHVHFEVRLNGKLVNPAQYIEASR